MSDPIKSETDSLYYEDDFDGEYKYKKFNNFSLILKNLLNIKKWREDRRHRAYGRIKASIFYYITMPMVFVFGMVVYTVVIAFPKLLPYYETNIALNGIIISLLIFGILKAFHNSYQLYLTAKFFRLVEEVIRKKQIPMEDIRRLRRSLERDGKLVNTVAMSETIDSIEKYGHPNFNDMRARLIKSKLGYRVGKNKGNVTYISGILVMLGLLGTFLGLLGTIDAVGEALKGMSEIGGGPDGGEIGVEQMSGFIGSLAKPLNGMGLAFSSSLFGLSGSLLIGFFIYLGGTPQNEFMENIGRWIDDRIPNPDPDKKPKGTTQAKLNPPPQEKDLKDWLAGFVNMSVKTNKMLSTLCEEISRSTEESKKIWEGTEAVHSTQERLISTSESTNSYLKKIDSHNAALSETMPSILGTANATLENVYNLKENSQNIMQILPSLNSGIAAMSKIMANNQEMLSHREEIQNTQKLIELQANSQNIMGQMLKNLQQIAIQPVGASAENSLKSIENNIAEMNVSNRTVSQELKALLDKLESDSYAAKSTEGLMKRLEAIMNELNSKFKGYVGK